MLHALTERGEPRFVDSMLREPGHDALGARLAQLPVVRGVADAVGVSLDAHVLDLGMILEDAEDGSADVFAVLTLLDRRAVEDELHLLEDLDLALRDERDRAAVLL